MKIQLDTDFDTLDLGESMKAVEPTHPRGLTHGKKDVRCETSGKLVHSSLHAASLYARLVSRGKISEGVRVVNMYAYVCKDCGRWHLTRSRGLRDDEQNHLAYQAPSAKLQEFAHTVVDEAA